MKKEFNLKLLESHIDIVELSRSLGLSTQGLRWRQGAIPNSKTIGLIVKYLNGLGIDICGDDLITDSRLGEMRRLESAGMNHVEIGKLHGISKARVGQILGIKTRERECCVCGEHYTGWSVTCGELCAYLLKQYGGKKPPYEALRLTQILDNIRGNGDCWEWQGYLNVVTGQLVAGWRGASRDLRRVLWSLMYGEPTDPVSTSCGNKLCCNPNHLIQRRLHNYLPRLTFGEVRAVKDAGVGAGRIKDTCSRIQASGVDATASSIYNVVRGRTFKDV